MSGLNPVYGEHIHIQNQLPAILPVNLSSKQNLNLANNFLCIKINVPVEV